MGVIDPSVLERKMAGNQLVEVKNAQGVTIGWKGPFVESVYDNMTECLRDNQNARRIQEAKSRGLNEHGQTKEQEAEFKKKQKEQLARKERADMALAAAQNAGALGR